MKASEIKNTRLIAKVRPKNMTYPKSGHQPGEFAIVRFEVLKIVKGDIPDECIDYVGMLATSHEEEDALKNKKYTITVKGNMPQVSFVSDYVLTADLMVDEKWGPQYNIITMRLDYDLGNPEDQRKFFGFFMTENQVDSLFETFANPIDLLETKNIGLLTSVKGIGEFTARKLCERYEGCKDNSRAYIALGDLGLTKNAIDKLIEFYGSVDVVIDKINENPYILSTEVAGYGWKRCDHIAQKKGIAKNSQIRVNAYTKYYLEQQAEINGNSWVKIDDLLIADFNECAPIDKQVLMDWVRELMAGPEEFDKYYSDLRNNRPHEPLNKMPLLFYNPDNRRVSLFSLRLLEKNIARHLRRLKRGNMNSDSQITYNKEECEKVIKECEEKQGFEFSSEQREAIWMILNNNVCLLTGSAGTGKSSTLAPIMDIFRSKNLRIAQCALSGRAASKLTEMTHVEGKTIHRLLQYIPDKDCFAYTERNQMPYDVIVLDETSMVGGEIFLCLIQAIRTGSKLILVGDEKQLEAIGLANILKDCLYSHYIPTKTLTMIHRQAAASGIITQSIHVANGQPIMKSDFIGSELRGNLKDFKIVGTESAELVQHQIIQEFKELYFGQKIPADDIQVIVPMRTRGNISCITLNNIIQNIVNPGVSPESAVQSYKDNGIQVDVCYKVNDRIIVIKNNYQARGVDGQDKQIFNGYLGHIKHIQKDAMIVNIDLVGDIILPRNQWYDISLGYALTAHKLQGSQAPYCIIGLNTSCYALYSKEWLYTAITRAQKYCVLVTQPKAVNQAVRISHVKTKQTWLQEELYEFFIHDSEEEIEG